MEQLNGPAQWTVQWSVQWRPLELLELDSVADHRGTRILGSDLCNAEESCPSQLKFSILSPLWSPTVLVVSHQGGSGDPRVNRSDIFDTDSWRNR